MAFTRVLAALALSAGPLAGAAPARSEPPEPLVITQLPDPEPTSMSVGAEKRGAMRAHDGDENPALDQAILDFGRAIGQATRVQEEAIEARCKSGEPSGGNLVDRLSWAANCRYQRY